ncbi:MAG: hypothetical protein PHR25_01880 [Clostridia bacterium]|nr:hypothetical protein [Clostridia bacterium]MDD4375508.1 hypothetical protein [Clostridia bacterium]
MYETRKNYQVFVTIVMLVLLTIGVFIGMKFSKDDEGINEDYSYAVSNKEVEMYEEDENRKELEEEEEKDIEVIYVDIYDGCNHASESRSLEYGATLSEVKKRELEKIEREKSGYKLVKDTDGILMFEKKHNEKCENHYLLKLDGDIVIIYRWSNEDGYIKYQETDIDKEIVRPDLKEQLVRGIEAETLEQLYMFLEDLES